MTLGASALIGQLQKANRSHNREPLQWTRWLPVQYRYLTSNRSERLLRAGNQVGKTYGALADLYWHATGEHPWRPCHKHGEYWIICASWSQSVAVQGKLDDILATDRVHPNTPEFDEKNGFGAKNPTVKVRHDDGGWSVIRFKTTAQGAMKLSSATIDGALFDEPPTTQRIYSEVRKRVMRRSGWVSIAMTPVNAPIEWIRTLAEAGGIEDIHTRMTPEALTPMGSQTPIRLKDGTICDAEWIAEETKKTPEHEVPVVIHGEWEFRSTGRYFAPFISSGTAAGAHVHSRLPTGRVEVCLGIDYGTLPGKQIIHLVLVSPRPHPKDPPPVYVLDSYVDVEGNALPSDDANGVLEMLTRHRMTWTSLDHAWGDRVHMPGTGSQKSNRDLQVQVSKILRLPVDAMKPPIKTVKRGQGRGSGSLSTGCRWLYHAMVRPGGFGVHPRCERLIDALNNFDIQVDDDHKDPVDALRYSLQRFIFGRWKSGGGTVRFG